MQLLIQDSWLYALDGERLHALKKVRDAIRIAPNRAWQVWALANMAAVCNAFGELGMARLYAEDARLLANRVQWNATTGDERMGLLHLTEVLAIVEPKAALAMLMRYDDTTPETDKNLVHREGSADPRLVGWDLYVRGLVARAGRDFDRATQCLREAAATLRSCGYLWLTALVLIELDATPVDHSDEAPLEQAAIIIRDNFPQSFLAARLGPWAWAYLDPIAASLTSAQREVLRCLLQGMSPKVIAFEKHRTLYTVRRHIEAIYRAFDVHSAGELYVECFQRGIGAPKYPIVPAADRRALIS